MPRSSYTPCGHISLSRSLFFSFPLPLALFPLQRVSIYMRLVRDRVTMRAQVTCLIVFSRSGHGDRMSHQEDDKDGARDCPGPDAAEAQACAIGPETACPPRHVTHALHSTRLSDNFSAKLASKPIGPGLFMTTTNWPLESSLWIPLTQLPSRLSNIFFQADCLSYPLSLQNSLLLLLLLRLQCDAISGILDSVPPAI